MRKTIFCLNVYILLSVAIGNGIAQEVITNEVTTYSIVTPKATPITTSTSTQKPTSIPTTKESKKNSKSSLDCPSECICFEEKKITCENKDLKKIPPLSKFTEVTEISLRGNDISTLDFGLLPVGSLASLKKLDLGDNHISTINSPSKNLKDLKLKTLILSDNPLKDLKTFSAWSFSALEKLDLSNTSLVEIGPSSFNKSSNLKNLKLDRNPDLFLSPSTFINLTQLQHLNLSQVPLTNQLGDRLFIKNQNLEVLDLSECSLLEVPVALRTLSSLKSLTLNRNLMTSLRESDFVNTTSLIQLEIRECPKLKSIDESAFIMLVSLETLIIADNPRLQYISNHAFGPERKHKHLVSIDLSGNNLTTLHDDLQDIKGMGTTDVKSLILNNNPWNCNCDLEWIQTIPTSIRSPVHCKTPEQYKDIEISQFFAMKDCKIEDDSNIHTVLVTGFLLFLFGLMVAVFVQKSEFCRRLLWKDQYGTIYYTKASFPAENA